MNQLLNEIFKRNTSAVVYRDNQGALYLVKNRQNQLVHEAHQYMSALCKKLQRWKKVIGQLVQSKECMADGATKNLPEKLFT